MSMKIKIDDAFRNFWPPLSEDQIKGLESDMLIRGCIDPLVTWHGVLADGYHRYDICQKHGIKYETKELEDAETKDDVLLWIFQTHKNRRNLTKYEVAEKALILEPMFRKQAEERELAGKKTDPIPNLGEGLKTGTVEEHLANAAGVSHGTMAKVMAIAKEATLEQKRSLRSGRLSIHQVHTHIRKKKKQEQRQEKLTKAVASIEEPQAIIECGDFRKLIKKLPDNSIDLILTDPPYAEKYLPLWEALAQESSRVLKPSGYFIAYSGQGCLVEVLNILSKHLSYYWLGMLYHRGTVGQQFAVNMWNRAKPILFFYKPPLKKQEQWLDDVLTSEEPDKSTHDWQQNIEPVKKLIECFSESGSSVCDPLMGSGTTIYACLLTGRKIYGFEIDKDVFNSVKQLISKQNK